VDLSTNKKTRRVLVWEKVPMGSEKEATKKEGAN